MFKTTIKNLKSAKANARPFSLLLLASLCIFSTLVVNNAHAAQPATQSPNPQGSIVSSMDAAHLGQNLINDGEIEDGDIFTPFLNQDIKAGMYGKADTTFNFENYASIRVLHDDPTKADAYGIYANGNGNHILTNHGDTFATATGGSNNEANGMFSFGSGDHILTNRGGITATATVIAAGTTARAYGMSSSSSSGNVTLNNSGRITATATATATATGGYAYAYGMYITGGANFTLNNTGSITVTGANLAFEAYGRDDYNVDTWATTLRPWSSNDAVFSADAGATVNFANSKLILRADNRTVMGQDYRIYDATNNNGMVSAASGATVSGTIAAVTTESPTLKATLVGNDPATATVRLEANVNSSTTPNPTASQQAVVVTHGQMANIARELRQITFNNISPTILLGDAGSSALSGMSAGSSMDENKWLVFMNPYANAVSNSEYNFNGSHMGITVGGSYKVSEQFSFGAHLDFNAANYAAEVYDMKSKATSFALGMHGTYNFTPEWYLQGQITGAISQTDSYYHLGGVTPADANSTYNGESLFMSLNAGYVWKVAGDNSVAHSLTPVLGLSYLNSHTAAYDVDWGNAALAIYDMKYDDTYYSALYGNVNLDWRSEWALQNDASIALLAGLGLRQSLSGSEVVSNLRTLGGSYSTRTSEDMTTWLADVGVEYTKGNFSVSLNYDGAYGTKQTSHGGNVMVKIEF